jgi:glycosyltransferase
MNKMITKQTKPIVTIVTVTFNLIKSGREKTFRQCLESVHNQTYDNIEHIVIDGASNDGTVDLIEEYAKINWIRYISEPDSGIYDAMNKGIKMAEGKYISFLNSDDYYHDVAGVQTSIDALEISGATFSYAPVINLDEVSGTRQTIYPEISKVFFSITPNHQTMFISRDVMIEEGMFNSNFKCIADYDMTIRLCLKKYKSVYIEDSFLTYRLGGFSLEATNDGTVTDEIIHIYLNNYSHFYPIKPSECEKLSTTMYQGDYDNVPMKLARKLKTYEPYFNFKEYITGRRLGDRIKRRLFSFFSKGVVDK